MYTSSLSIIILAATLASAAPLNVNYVNRPSSSDPHAKTINDAAAEAHRRVVKMRETLDHPNDPTNRKRIETAFGRNANLHEISTVVGNLEHGNLPVLTADPTVYDRERGKPANAVVSYNRDSKGKIDTKGWPMKHAKIGSRFHGMSKAEQAGTLIHEATHYQSLTGDDVGKHSKVIQSASSDKVYSARGGYATDNRGATITSDTIKADQGASLKNTPYDALRKNSPNMHQNADSYRVFAALCARSLYKRALESDDPVNYYLAKRSQCSLPPDYFAKKAAAKKAAAAKGTTAATPKTGATAKTAATAKTGIKTTKAKGAKAGKGVKATKGVKAAKGVKATKGVKGAKSLKAVKGLRSAKAAGKGVKAVKGSKLSKASKAVRGTKGTKALKGAKAVKGAKSLKSSRGSKAAKGTKTLKGAKAVKGVKSTKARKASKPVKSAKTGRASKPAKATKAVKATKGETTAKATQRKATKAATKPAVARTAQLTSKAVPKVAAAKKAGKKNRRDLQFVLESLD